MGLFLCVLTDIIHLLTILLMCQTFFSFHRREFKHKRKILILLCFILVVLSIFIYLYDNDIIEMITYITTMILMVFILYKERVYSIVIVTMWMLFAISVVNLLTTILVEIFVQFYDLNDASVIDLVATSVSCILINALGIVYRKNTTTTLQTIGFVNMTSFTILLVMDACVVSAIRVGADMYEGSRRTLYLIAVVFIIIGTFIQLSAVIILFAQRNVYKEKEQITSKYLNEQKNHYEYLENREKETKKFRHDLRSHMDLISNLAKRHDYDKIDDYLEQMNTKIDTFGNVVTVHNGIVDAIINQYYMKAQENGVQMKVEGKFPVDCSIEAYDLCTIFSNVLSNAYEAAVETEEKKISLVCGYTERNIIIAVENSCRKKATTEVGLWKTKKNNADYHGYGLENIKDSVQKYDGIFDIEIKDNMCMLKILFNHKNES